MTGESSLFPDLPEQLAPVPILQAGGKPIWTQHKAQLIARYLRYFVFITKHGAYIDGFAGRKDPDNPNSWAAEEVLASEPMRLKQFYLCEIDSQKVRALEELKASQPVRPKRAITIEHGDFNSVVDRFLAAGEIKDKTATFCLIDQYTMECHWDTLEKLARHKSKGERKIELFYFLATGWLGRSLKAHTRNLEEPERWWGNPNWQWLCGMKGDRIAIEFATRMRDELGYRYVRPWPIHARQGAAGRVMFHMIHASDHPEARKLMYRAYRTVLEPPETDEQLEMALGQLADANQDL